MDILTNIRLVYGYLLLLTLALSRYCCYCSCRADW